LLQGDSRARRRSPTSRPTLQYSATRHRYPHVLAPGHFFYQSSYHSRISHLDDRHFGHRNRQAINGDVDVCRVWHSASISTSFTRSPTSPLLRPTGLLFRLTRHRYPHLGFSNRFIFSISRPYHSQNQPSGRRQTFRPSERAGSSKGDLRSRTCAGSETLAQRAIKENFGRGRVPGRRPWHSAGAGSETLAQRGVCLGGGDSDASCLALQGVAGLHETASGRAA
jgi:hypothetical protein